MDPTGLIAALPLPAMLIGSEGRIIAANGRAADLFGSGLEGRDHVTALRRPELLDAIDVARARRRPETARLLQRRSDSDQIWQVSVAPAAPLGAPAEAPSPVLVTFEDVTPVEAAGQMRRDFVANVSHELKSPLTAVLGFIETLRTSAKEDPAARERFLSIMEREAQRMNRLVSDLLSLSRVEAEERLRPREEVSLVPLVRRTLASLKAVIEDKGAEIVTELPETDVIVPGDDDQLQQVLGNLIENAIKYGRAKGRVTIRLIPAQPDPALGVTAARLVVEDEGEGFDRVHIPRLTERFYRIDNHRSRQSGGTGLGLAIVKHIVARHRGRLKIESEPGVGSRFSVLLPQNCPAQANGHSAA